MLRHLHFVQSVETLQGGGLGGAALGLHRALRQLGADSALCCTRAPASAPSGLEGVSDLPRSGPTKAYFSRRLAAVARRLAAAADILHGHGFYVATNLFFGREARRRGLPLVHHVQGFFDPWILRRARAKKRVAHLLFEDANFRYCRLWRALSGKEADQIRAAGIRGEIIILPNGIDLAAIDGPGELPAGMAKRRSRRLLLLSRIHPKKGFDIFLPAWARLAARYPDWEVAICGPDEDGYLSEVRRLVAGLGLEATCRLFPPVIGAAKRAMFASADLFCLPSHSEGFPVAVVEAAAHRLPVVMTDECNFPELGAAGAAWVCRPEPGSLGRALGAAVAVGEADRAAMGRAGRRLVEAGYTWDRIARQLDDACRSLG